MEENLPNLIDEIGIADWEKTPESVKRLVANLIGQFKQLVRRFEQLEGQYEELKAHNQVLKEQVQQNSKNSSTPPSQDIKKGLKPKEAKKSGKKRGGQPGHEGHERPLYLRSCSILDKRREVRI